MRPHGPTDEAMGDKTQTMEREGSPQLPTSGQILGVLVRNLGLNSPELRSKQAQRYFSGRNEIPVKESTLSKIVEAIADALGVLGLAPPRRVGKEPSASEITPWLEWQALRWDGLRTFLLPRMPRVYPSDIGAVWRTYVRLAAIDVALRIAAHLHIASAPLAVVEFLAWIGGNRRGAYLNELRKDAGVTVMRLAEAVKVDQNAVDRWMYENARPSDENVIKIGRALTWNEAHQRSDLMIRDLRRLYWISDIAGVLGKHLGTDAVDDIAVRLHRYTSQTYRILADESLVGRNTDELTELTSRGAASKPARCLLARLAQHESDEEWRRDLSESGPDWVRRVLDVNMQIDQAEVSALIEETDGRIFESWDVRNPEAFEHYQRSLELQAQGEIGEALTHVARAIELDPQDPVNHFTLGSMKGGIGADRGDEVLVKEGLEACWMAVALDPKWILPWTEIGWILLQTGKAPAAVKHLRAVRRECEPLDARYFAALGTALQQLERYGKSLEAFEASLKLNPDDMSVALAAAVAALLAGNKLKSNRYRKVARRLGASPELDRYFELLKTGAGQVPGVGGNTLHT